MDVSFEVEPADYRHWHVTIDGAVATVTMDVAEDGGIQPGYELKLNSYDLGVDIELADIVQRLRFEHPEVGAVVLTSAKDKVFCAGANIRMLASAEHAWKVNFCKFTNETRNAMEDATEHSGQVYIAAVNGTASGGGYELALACDTILLVDDRSAAVALPELPLLGVLPATGGLTRVVDKRRVRRDLADVFATKAEGVGGKTAVEWRLVDEAVPRVGFAEAVATRAAEIASASSRPRDAVGIALTSLHKRKTDDEIAYDHVTVAIDRDLRAAEILINGPTNDVPLTIDADFWPLAMARELDDAILHLRTNEPEIGTWILRTKGTAERVLAHDALMHQSAADWLVNEVIHDLKRVFKRLDYSSRSIFTLIDEGSCFAGTLAEFVFAADRSYQLDQEAVEITVTTANLGLYPMGNGLSRLATRFFYDPDALAAIETDKALNAREAQARGLVTFAPDDIDWDDELRVALEERASFSPDALTGLEANFRFIGPETLETKIFGRLTAWQNWIFMRPNAVGAEGALRRYGTGQRPQFDRRRV
jgi:benzoyl-CoA-dihydrodiol lyase